MSERPKVGVGIAIRRKGQILIGLRKGDHACGVWAFPGGHLEHGETPTTCALRETAEECGVSISQPWLGIVSNDLFDNGRHYITLIMIADWISGEAQNLEPDKTQRWEWRNWNDLPDNLMPALVNMQKAGFDPIAAQRPQQDLLITLNAQG